MPLDTLPPQPDPRAPRLWYVALGNAGKSFIAATIHTREDVRGLRECGWNATLFTQSDAPACAPPDVPEVILCKNRPFVYRVIFEILFILRLIRARPRPTFVLFRGTGLCLSALALRMASIKFGIELCGPPSSLLPTCRRGSFHLGQSYVMRHASVVVALTQELAELVSPICRAGTVITVTGVGVNCQEYRIRQAPSRPAGAGPILGFLGTIYRDRGLMSMIDAIARLLGRGLSTRLVVVGDGPFRMEAQRYATELGIAEHVHFTGFVPPADLADAVAPCDLMLAFYDATPSLQLGGINPMKVWTSLALGKPVVLHNPGRFNPYADVPGIFMCRDADPDRIAAILDELWRNYGRDGLANAGLQARQYVAENVTWRDHARAIDSAVRRALPLSARPGRCRRLRPP